MSQVVRKCRLIVVLGMHRSGTSAVTRALDVIGVELGNSLEPAVSGVNDKGFWEDRDVNSLNTEILHFLGHDWQSLYCIDPGVFLGSDLAPFRERAMALLREKTRGAAVFGLKNPRMCRLLPFWRPIFAELDFDVSYVLSLRHPKSVALSLMKRDQLVAEQSFLLWLEHLVQAVLDTEGCRRVVIDYDLLMDEPEEQIGRLARNLEIELPGDFAARLDFFCGEFLDEGLRHTRFDEHDLMQDKAALSDVMRTYSCLLGAARDVSSLDAAHEVFREVGERLRAIEPLMGCLTRFHGDISSLKQQLAEKAVEAENLTRELVEKVGEAESLVRCVAERNAEIIALRKSNTELWRGQGELQVRLDERNNALKFVEGVVRERNADITELEEAARLREGIISTNLQLIDELRREVDAYRNSNSWRVTAPLRTVGVGRQRLMHFARLFQTHRRRHPGVAGLTRMVAVSYKAMRGGGRRGLSVHFARYEASAVDESAQIVAPSDLVPLRLSPQDPDAVSLPQDIAVHAHVFYPDLAPEIREYLENIPSKFLLYVTTDTSEKAEIIREEFRRLGNAREVDVRVVANRGRDVAPLVVALGRELSKHEVVLHIHSKRSPHNLALRGWRRYLMESFLGSRETIAAQLEQFSVDSSLGILAPQPYYPVIPFMRIGGNAGHVRALLRKARVGEGAYGAINESVFPAGGMFWFRGEAIRPLVNLNLRIDDFEHENGQDDATIAHAIERTFPFFARKGGLLYREFVQAEMHDPEQRGVQKICRLPAVWPDVCSASVHVVFDHSLGGGTNHYGQSFFNEVIAQGQSVIRVYPSQRKWIAEWIDRDTGMFFGATGLEDVFRALESIPVAALTVNSLYAAPAVDEIVARIVNFARDHNVPVDYKVHDFFPICPSQHLLDWRDSYCGVPRNLGTCRDCLKRNPSAHWPHTGNADISEWRNTFGRLWECASTITAFDESAVEILGKVYELDDDRVRVVPHVVPPFAKKAPITFDAPLHVGIFGTLTTAKGAAVIERLAAEIEARKLDIRITVVGHSMVPIHPGVRVLGRYERECLPEIIAREGINLFFMASVIPETYSYTTSEAMNLGLPIVAFDIGAQGRRVNAYPRGLVVPLDTSPGEILESMHAALETVKIEAESCSSTHR